jgi:hypothetical protein
MADDVVLFDSGNSRITWEAIGEGWTGDFNPSDPTDEELLRFYVQWLDPKYKEWIDAEHGSYCTAFSAKATPEQRCKALEWMARQLEGVREDGNFKRTCERLSWVSLETISEKV